MQLHSGLTANHRPFADVYPDAAARLAATGFPRALGGGIVAFTAADLYKEALQLSDWTTWALIDESPATWVQTSGPGLAPAIQFRTALIVFEFGDGKNASSLEADQIARVPYVPGGTIVRARIVGDVSGSAVVDIQKSTEDPPSFSSIAASAKPTLSSDVYVEDTTLTDWDTTLSAGNELRAVLESVTTCKQVTVVLEIVKS